MSNEKSVQKVKAVILSREMFKMVKKTKENIFRVLLMRHQTK